MTNIFVDADACPVKEEVYKVALRHQIKVWIVSNGGIRPQKNPLLESIFVQDGLDEADDWIAERAKKGDIVITSDIPLASRCIENGSLVVSTNGEIYNESNIGNILSRRNIMTEIRSSDPFYKGTGKPFSNKDRSRFLNALEGQVRLVIKTKK